MDNAAIAAKILSFDPKAQWVYNRFCRTCARHIYPNDIICKKCKTSVADCIKHPLPFLTSATAIEKVVLWIRGGGLDGFLPREELYQQSIQAIEVAYRDFVRIGSDYKREIATYIMYKI
jgi:hypothetical protein